MGASERIDGQDPALDRIKAEAQGIGTAFVAEARWTLRAGTRVAVYGYRPVGAQDGRYRVKLVTQSELVANGDFDVAALVGEYDPETEVVVCAYDAVAQLSYSGILRVGLEGAGEVHSYFVAREAKA